MEGLRTKEAPVQDSGFLRFFAVSQQQSLVTYFEVMYNRRELETKAQASFSSLALEQLSGKEKTWVLRSGLKVLPHLLTLQFSPGI